MTNKHLANPLNIQTVLWKTSCRFPEDNFCIILQNNGNPENSLKTVSSGYRTPREARICRGFQGLHFIPTQQAILDTLHFCLDFVIIHALCDLYYPVSMDYTDLLLSNRYHR